MALAVGICLVVAFSFTAVPSSATSPLQGQSAAPRVSEAPLLLGASVSIQAPPQEVERSDRAVVLKRMEAARAATAPARRAAHTALGGIAQQLATAMAQPGIRNSLLAQVRASQKREQMLELEEFVVGMSKRPDVPATARVPDLLAAVRKTKTQIGGSGIRSGFAARNIDLYFPVSQHRQNWQGNDDLIVAAPPLDESDTAPILAYSVRTGQPVTLDPKAPPAAPVLVVAACEHQDHERKQEQRAPGIAAPPFEIKSPLGQLFDNEKPVLVRGKYPGNSYIYGYYTGIKDNYEGWFMGSAEIYVVFVQYCGGNDRRRFNVYYVDDNYKNYYTMPDEVVPYTSACSDHTHTAIWESDGGSNVWHSVVLILPNGSYWPNSGYNSESNDEFIEDRYWFKSSIPYNSVSSVGLGYNAWVTMLKRQ